ncbi:hypothetical protein SAMN06265367_101684 [Algoriphagus winogradskyi]|uniref:Uncharacterized protein n=1 Tax=Algoriphagus winogradskyi TaxID=237017 RepID=A0ABY1NFG4_9BACT|nr:hypothetical protein SAMN06265367_101684 [Algoriphagus winogradskyi]
MRGGLNDSTVTGINFLIVGYFICLWLVNFLELNSAIIVFFVELLTIPFLLAQLVFLVLGVKFVFQNKKRPLTIFSLFILAICSICTLASFFC